MLIFLIFKIKKNTEWIKFKPINNYITHYFIISSDNRQFFEAIAKSYKDFLFAYSIMITNSCLI